MWSTTMATPRTSRRTGVRHKARPEIRVSPRHFWLAGLGLMATARREATRAGVRALQGAEAARLQARRRFDRRRNEITITVLDRLQPVVARAGEVMEAGFVAVLETLDGTRKSSRVVRRPATRKGAAQKVAASR
jgi:hypothetical protein